MTITDFIQEAKRLASEEWNKDDNQLMLLDHVYVLSEYTKNLCLMLEKCREQRDRASLMYFEVAPGPDGIFELDQRYEDAELMAIADKKDAL